MTNGSERVEPGLAPAEPRALIGVVGNVPHQAPNWLFHFGTYDLAVVEFDDQGVCHDRGQMQGLADKLSGLESDGQDAIVIAFVHGWKHDARSDDTNLQDFAQKVLEKAAAYENQRARAEQPPQDPRPVLGVFVGWRGMTLYDSRYQLLENLTFWDRQQAGRRVATGSVRELFGYLRRYRDSRIKIGQPLVAVVGHSFGGMIVFSALAQSLIEAAATPVGELVPSLADLVLLVNPAIEGARYLPVWALVKDRQRMREPVQQPPIFVCATATNDWATGLAFPLGNAWSLLTEKWKDWRQRQAMLRTIGHISWMKTHDLTDDPTSPVGYVLSPPSSDGQSAFPFWVVAAAREVIDGHSGIFGDRFLSFVADLIFQHAKHTVERQRNR
jgi:pimeloyl-ACP methyl ester carboxylesterase